jgi:hypothetical protein
MKYTAVIAIMDGQPDSMGDVLHNNVKMPEGAINVRNEFQGPKIGLAHCKIEGDNVLAEIEIDSSILPPELLETMCGVVGGYTTKRTGNLIEEWKLIDVGLTKNPCDKRLPKLKRKE